MTVITKYLLTTLLLIPLHSFADYEQLSASKINERQNDIETTHVRCWFRPSNNHDESDTDWKWARDDKGKKYKLSGYWFSSTALKNMFYTDTPHAAIMERCENTLNVDAKSADVTFFAADNRLSFNHTIWTNDTIAQRGAGRINKIVNFGDSISDTGNIYNASEWKFPNDDSWFLGRFSNGFVWTEYLALAKDIPVYTWAIGGAEGKKKYGLLTGIDGQIDSYLNYMQLSKNYEPKNTLVTLEFGLNDFVNDDRTVSEVSNDFAKALERLTASGIDNIIVLNLPDATTAPQFKYAEAGKVDKVRSKFIAYNAFLGEEVARHRSKGVNVRLYDTWALFERILQAPQDFGFRNVADSCLDINRSSPADYLMSHDLRPGCSASGSDTYLFWGVTHPTTKAHNVISNEIVDTLFPEFDF